MIMVVQPSLTTKAVTGYPGLDISEGRMLYNLAFFPLAWAYKKNADVSQKSIVTHLDNVYCCKRNLEMVVHNGVMTPQLLPDIYL